MSTFTVFVSFVANKITFNNIPIGIIRPAYLYEKLQNFNPTRHPHCKFNPRFSCQRCDTGEISFNMPIIMLRPNTDANSNGGFQSHTDLTFKIIAKINIIIGNIAVAPRLLIS